ncbi:hypothetical protein GCM10018980_68340 [Streptomyces capoamus]|uniref:Rad50/SbcC-type AAA domain-containing protein n=1 Tax=Streptomyces capoamus TaxID=68183 RepID=A0A919F2D7_9ACTN|nr:hypothetical protein [Streptomyces capoamus]GGP32450.1 hypothetical protein GCM10010501_75050 [Streptomyces libani subsp. rufus]GHG72504.1 hypothetical protein GCM10018980_68340 [Streptomyces capoamus]
MSALTLLHLTFVGPGKTPAAVEFGRHLTVIYGASDTGKSFIVEAIDYMLGASSLKEIQEADGYTRILLGLRLADGQTVTLSRAPDDNKVEIHSGDVRALTTAPPEKTLNIRHSATSENNLSRYLLKLIGADGRNLLKNQRGDRVSLSFRHLAHLCVISETQMAAPRSPVLTSGQNTSATAEKSAFKYLLTGADDPEGPKGASDVDKKVGKGKIDLLDQVITDTRDSLTIEANEAELREQLGRLETALASASAVVGDLIARRSALLGRTRTLESRTTDNRTRAGEVRSLLARFDLLRQQYESDLARLQMVAEAGTLLGYFRTGTCVFCGATPEHQQAGHHLHETTQLQAAVVAETRKTAELHTDLLTTIEDLEAQLAGLDSEHAACRDEDEGLRRDLARLDERLAPLNADSQELLSTRSRIQADLAIHAQIQRLEEMKANLESSTSEQPPPARLDGIPAADLAEFERMVQQILQSWKVPGDNGVTYDQSTAEITVDGRPRSSRGKGMRSVIHAAFSTALAGYTAARDLSHPGFVVLDSPVLTYREPHEQDVQLTHNVVEHFYRGLLSDVPGQVIVVENGDPPRDLDEYATVYAFSTPGSERAGFFPAQGED